jgi:hypothetical protein
VEGFPPTSAMARAASPTREPMRHAASARRVSRLARSLAAAAFAALLACHTGTARRHAPQAARRSRRGWAMDALRFRCSAR